jgi:hypothetical protein
LQDDIDVPKLTIPKMDGIHTMNTKLCDSIERIMRCMNEDEILELTKSALSIISERCSFDPYSQYYPKQSPEKEEQDEEESLDEKLMVAWPGGWPGRKMVELDDLGDAGYWLEMQMIDSVSDILFSTLENKQEFARDMAQEYLQTVCELGVFVPSFYDNDENQSCEEWSEEDEQQITEEFTAFFIHWQERILEQIEKNCSKKKSNE